MSKTTNKPEVVAWYFPSSITTLPVVSLNAGNGNGQSLIRLSDYEALQAECEKLAESLQLFVSNPTPISEDFDKAHAAIVAYREQGEIK